MSVHVERDTPVRVQLHPAENRVVLVFGEETGLPTLDLYVRRAELVALRDTLAAAVADLDTARCDMTGEPGGTGPRNEVRDPAA